MTRKQMRLTKETLKKNQSYLPGGLDELIKEVKNKKNEDNNIVRMNFEVPEKLRNAFKSKTAQQGKKVKDVLVALMAEYVRNKEPEK